MPQPKTLPAYVLRRFVEITVEVMAVLDAEQAAFIHGLPSSYARLSAMGQAAGKLQFVRNTLLDLAVADVEVEAAPAWTETVAELARLQGVIDHGARVEAV
jgi:tetrahydromethanopterin S-methyltransferase subunit E